MHQYEIIIDWIDEDKAFIAGAPKLPGFAAHGNSPDMALANRNEAINLWIETAKEFGRTIPEPKGRRLQYAQGITASFATHRRRLRQTFFPGWRCPRNELAAAAMPPYEPAALPPPVIHHQQVHVVGCDHLIHIKPNRFRA
jgi:predicted RNase H-like HicB family nuclease